MEGAWEGGDFYIEEGRYRFSSASSYMWAGCAEMLEKDRSAGRK